MVGQKMLIPKKLESSPNLLYYSGAEWIFVWADVRRTWKYVCRARRVSHFNTWNPPSVISKTVAILTESYGKSDFRNQHQVR